MAKQNTLDDADVYDMTFEDSWRSPTVRDKVRQQIIQLQQNPAVGQDPTLNAFLTYYFLQLSDAPQEMKSLVKEHSQVIAQAEAQKRQQEQDSAALEQQGQMQDIAQKEAEGTAMSGGQPPQPPQIQQQARPQPGMQPQGPMPARTQPGVIPSQAPSNLGPNARNPAAARV